MTELRVRYTDGEPQEIEFGRGMMGECVSLAYVDGTTAIIAFDNSGSTDFERALLELPFIEEIHEQE